MNSSRIGVDDIAGAADIELVGDAADVRTYRVADFAALAEAIGSGEVAVLDVRQADEFADSHIDGAVNIPLHELIDRVNGLPVGEVWVHCASGYRASIAASILDRHGRDVVLIDDEFGRAEELNLTARCALTLAKASRTRPSTVPADHLGRSGTAARRRRRAEGEARPCRAR